jgi:N-acetylglucosamine malate deacetylase 1
MIKPVDVLAIGAHPDDVEMSAGGVLASMVQEGKRVAIVDCTQGEMGTRGSVEQRALEANNASKILGVHHRIILSMTDGYVEQTKQNIETLVSVIRVFKPTILLIPPAFERHPDHEAVHRLCRTAIFHSGLVKVQGHQFTMGDEHQWDDETKQRLNQLHRPKYVFTYIQSYHQEPDFMIDTSSTHHIKMESVRAYSSQVYTGENKNISEQGEILGIANDSEPQTYISSPEFMMMLDDRARYFGSQIGVKYAEGFKKVTQLGLPSLGIWL